MKRYPAYKDSGFEWISQIPEQWETSKLKYLAKVRLSNIDKKTNQGELPVSLCNYVDVYYNENITADLAFMTATAPSEKIDDLTLQEGDVIITKDSETPHDIAVPAYVPSTLSGVVCGYHLALIRPKRRRADGNFLFRSFVANGIRDQFEIAANGITRFGIGKYSIDNSLFLNPPVEEQRIIGKYLDHKTHLIDTLIEKKRKQINLLQEQRAALINHAVTKGLNPNVKMKDSEIEWLGEVPEHWQIKRFKQILKRKKGAIKTGPFGSQLKNEDFVEEGIKVYNQRTVLDNDFQNGDSFIGQEKFQALKAFEVFPGDILITSRGTIGKCAIVPDGSATGVLHPCLIRLQADSAIILNEYLRWYIQESQHFKESVLFESDATTIEVIYSDTLRNVRIPLPPFDEQRDIMAFLTLRTDNIDQYVERLQREVDLFVEYRTTLISEVVTGKIDVIGEAVP